MHDCEPLGDSYVRDGNPTPLAAECHAPKQGNLSSTVLAICEVDSAFQLFVVGVGDTKKRAGWPGPRVDYKMTKLVIVASLHTQPVQERVHEMGGNSLAVPGERELESIQDGETFTVVDHIRTGLAGPIAYC